MTTTASGIHRGLAGVVVDTTEISTVIQETNSLTYRGYPVQDLAARRSFEEVAHLLWHGELPDAGQLRDFQARERALRALDRTTLELLARLPETCHPMDVLRTAVSFFGAEDPTEDDGSLAANRAKSLTLLAKLPTVVAVDRRRRRGLAPIPPDPSLGYAENFFHMCFGSVPGPDVVRCFEISLTLYAEHSFNASTFTARVVTSTLSDLYSAVTAAVGALKGPLHGGANEAVMRMLLEIGDPRRAEEWLDEALASERKIMGFGHRVYKHGDSRVPIMQEALDRLVARAADPEVTRLATLHAALRHAMITRKGIHPNLDYPAALAYHLMGFDIPAFTPIFVMSRITGWTAHITEQLAHNALIRPLASYDGQEQRAVPGAA
ncbi:MULTISPECIES: bifunctional 2-methylcitrate synthase/citrate synthase [unclassified Streptomyces]|uniref:bifunctional 2-methylcitrate synthase/citrate synthase n=1 Tax=Streptomyces TaxID=1883 RepID=UPI0001C198B6|nr:MULTISPECIES: bifunctional 2-methylcitrate synthase/citrate synthase [unclassified Streptomyces]AEN13786.1 2-methylcitrate synthase/citrate synthase II [Streptomyces sp. SirexAA-E]MYR67155.1 bifunctional 2-methylcitrate synthase/citrate synthase [Streptomyces sp. SID4939]MYR99304.1 bifunctional 2-methylcitrate synthase/citrate synthase [Streptomyces sp. SID4940]MYT67675.1 bifunctional 2-methylcitrate synthase/citrate synthase [Streptomyces sp. SID8357]MYT86519.1 bifunctional 2-methylcitrate